MTIQHMPYSEYQDLSFDGELQKQALRYFPWIGRSYQNREHRVLIVPESTTENADPEKEAPPANAWITYFRQCLGEQAFFFLLPESADPDYKRFAARQPMWRGTERLFWNKRDVSNEERLKLWCSVAVHQFVQRPVSSNKERPNFGDYQDSAWKLAGVIRLVQPTLCVFLGTDGHKKNGLEAVFEPVRHLELGGERIGRAFPKVFDAFELATACRFVMVRHPSQFFSWSRWAPFLKRHSQGALEELLVLS